MKTIFYIIVLTAIITWAAEVKIQFSPFKITFIGWDFLIGMIFLTLGFLFINAYYYRQGKVDGIKKGVIEYNHYLQKELNKKDSSDNNKTETNETNKNIKI